jgi:undecaprenyl-diphosphatase
MEWIHRIDVAVVEAFNAFVGKSRAFDQLVVLFEANSLLKTGLLVGLLWYCWFSSAHQTQTRRQVIRILLAAFVAIGISRVAQRGLPERLRPIHDPTLQLQLPYGLDSDSHAEWSSFPSDHAVLMCVVATGLWAIARWYGIVAFIWAVLTVFVVRVYTGLHYPSDILAGGVMGVAIMWLVSKDTRITPRIEDAVLRIEPRRTALFYTVAFLITWQVASLFGECRQIVRVLWTSAKL